MKTQITIKDIAKALNISISTVSRALQDHPDISKKTKEIVNQYAKEHHYRPNAIALSLKTKRTNIIGVIVPEIVHHFFSSVFAGIEDTANKNGLSVIICQTSEDYEKEVKSLETLQSARVCGVIASLSKSTTNFEHYKDLMDENIPLVFFDRICTELKTDRVVTDDYNGAYMAVEHLIKTGCKRIAFFSAPSNMEISKNRENGYTDALRSHSLPVDRSLIFECDSKEKAIALTPEVLKMENRPDAIFCINDDTASGVLYAAKRSGFSIPEDISICGFGDGEVARACDPALTTIEQNGYDMGVKACTLLVNRVKNGNTMREVNHSVIRTSLVVRESTK
ncbi:MAG: LacI family DNA-binding transcriptional regulator [Paludibacteraceae bacterium]|nr:LacI family DNA-binding transcriptional regulator [Paludibacteraceae bacterium]